MTEVMKQDVSEEEERLRERLRAKKESKESEQRKEEERSSSPDGRPSSRPKKSSSSSSSHRRNRSRSRSRGKGGDSSSRGSHSHDQRHRGDSPSHHRRPHRQHRDQHRRDRHREHDHPPAPPHHHPPPPHHHHGPAPPYYHGPPSPHGYHRGGPPPPMPSGLPPPLSRGGGRPRAYDDFERDDYGRLRRPLSPNQRGSGGRRSRSHSSSRSRSRSRGRSRSSRSRSPHKKRSRRSRSYSYSSTSSSSSGSSSGSSSSSSSSSVAMDVGTEQETIAMEHTKDQRTVFVSQLVQRATVKDLKKYFKKHSVLVKEVILLRDKRGKHKGCAYVELMRLEDVIQAIGLSNQAPDFQRFPILVKPSEAEKNYVASKAQTTLVASQMRVPVDTTPLLDHTKGVPIQAQKVYVGSLSPTVTQEQLFALYTPFGDLQKVAMQMDASTGVSKGFAFLQFRDPKNANLAIQTMNGQTLAGRPMKTGWASQVMAGMNIITSDEFPADASVRTQLAYQALAQLSMGIPPSSILSALNLSSGTGSSGTAITACATPSASRVLTVADARASLATAAVTGTASASATPLPPAAVAPSLPPTAASSSASASLPPLSIGNWDNPTTMILVHNMFGDNESEEDLKEIQEDFEEEVKSHGLTRSILKGGGKIYAQFNTIEGAKTCASVLQGRWFDKRQLQVDFLQEMPES